MYNNEATSYSTYPLNTVELDGVQLRSTKALQGPTITKINEQPKEDWVKEPPFPGWFQSKPLQKEVSQLEFYFFNELRNVNIKILLLWAIKDTPIYTKIV